MAFALTKLSGKKGLNEIPGHRRSHGPSAHAKDVHVVVLDALPGREMVVNQSGANTLNLVGADRSVNATAADRDATIHFPSNHGLTEWDNEIGIIVVRRQLVSAEIDDLVPGRAEMSDQFLFQTKPAVIGGNSYAHVLSIFPVVFSFSAAALSASNSAVSH